MKPRERVVCKNGVSLSVQASGFHYCTPRKDDAPFYTHYEVGFIEDSMGNPIDLGMNEQWRDYAEVWNDEYGNEQFSGVYGWVPVEKVMKFIDDNGGLE